jgi:hypothetical protein
MVGGKPCVGWNITGKRYVLLCDSNLELRFRSSVMLWSSETSVTLYQWTWRYTSEDLNVYHSQHEDTKSHRLWLHVTKLNKVIIRADAVQVVTAFSRQGQFYDFGSIILLPLGTDLLYSDCMTCNCASGDNDLRVFPAGCCRSSWCYQYRCRPLQWWNLPFWEACCWDNLFTCGFATGDLLTWSWVDIEFIFRHSGIPV